MTQLLSISAAMLYGVSDFAGGLAARTQGALRVTAWSQLIGIPLLVISVVVVGATEVTSRDLLLGVAGGTFGLVGLVLMYSAFATGKISVVAPVIGALAASIPVVWDIRTGGSISSIQWVGIAISIAAVLLLTLERSDERSDPVTLLKAVGAAVAFAAFFITISYTDEASGLWPLVAGRTVTVPLGFLAAGVAGVVSLPKGLALRLVAFTGVADMGANVALLLALQRGPLGVTAVLSSLYPAFTVIAAMVVLKEHPNRRQGAGVLLAILAVALLAI